MTTPTAIRVWESELVLYKRIWKSAFFGTVLQPLLYLLGMGLGVGALVDAGPESNEILAGTSYFAFLAPALLATTAMMTGGSTSLWQVLDGFIWGYRYRAMAATTLSPTDVASGMGLWHATRIALGVVGVALALLLFDDTRSFGLLVAIPVAVLTGLAFAMPLTAWSATREQDTSFPAVLRFVLIPMFLFGGAFYPIDQLPGWLQPVAQLTPLWHGVEVCRAAVVGDLVASDVAGHLAVLVGFVAVGWLLAVRAFSKRLHT